MRKYLVKRLLLSVVILFFVTFIIYVLMRCLPREYGAAALAGSRLQAL